jgi:hypothetical protein
MSKHFQLVRACCNCGYVPCVWETHVDSMILLSKVHHEEEAMPKQGCHLVYQQMALIINEGPSGHGNRVKLPNYVLAGVWELFLDPGGEYRGHREKV